MKNQLEDKKLLGGRQFKCKCKNNMNWRRKKYYSKLNWNLRTIGIIMILLGRTLE